MDKSDNQLTPPYKLPIATSVNFRSTWVRITQNISILSQFWVWTTIFCQRVEVLFSDFRCIFMYSIPSTGSWRPYALRLSTDWFDWTEKYIFSIFLPVLPLTSLYTIVSQSHNLVIRTSPLGVSHRRLCDILKDIKNNKDKKQI